MTTKKTLKKLTLKKESIANLNNAELNQLKGGVATFGPICTSLYATMGLTIGGAALYTNFTGRSLPGGFVEHDCNNDDFIYDGGELSEVVIYG